MTRTKLHQDNLEKTCLMLWQITTEADDYLRHGLRFVGLIKLNISCNLSTCRYIVKYM